MKFTSESVRVSSTLAMRDFGFTPGMRDNSSEIAVMLGDTSMTMMTRERFSVSSPRLDSGEQEAGQEREVDADAQRGEEDRPRADRAGVFEVEHHRHGDAQQGGRRGQEHPEDFAVHGAGHEDADRAG